ncbi:mRNA splicing protein [Dimargaris cristalligena]|nr:mRNA splicing protein [Dimargaris cristalligena]
MSSNTASSGKLSREDYRRMKDLDAARKAGTAPAEVDEEGNEINPHIPQYIAQAPWYADAGNPSLKHQRVLETFSTKLGQDQKAVGSEKFGLKNWYARGQTQGPAATTFRKGACTNCGAMTHKTKDCLDRPRKQGARWTGKDIKPDEVIRDVELSFEGKRDRWNGYDPNQHTKVIKDWEFINEQREKFKDEQRNKALLEGGHQDDPNNPLKRRALGDLSDDGDDTKTEEQYAEGADMPGQKVDTKSRKTIRNLRIREDTAKYLRNLDPNSAHYDPKTRSMRDNPYKGQDPNNVAYAGDNFVRYTGEANRVAEMQLFAHAASERGNSDVHLQANPTQGELLHREFKGKQQTLLTDSKADILAKYGGEEHLKAPPKELLMAQTENYVEYSRSGKVIRGQERAIPRSKYEEDVFPGNHASVWGSYWVDGKWGYQCCHATMRNAYCTGPPKASTATSVSNS